MNQQKIDENKQAKNKTPQDNQNQNQNEIQKFLQTSQQLDKIQNRKTSLPKEKRFQSFQYKKKNNGLVETNEQLLVKYMKFFSKMMVGDIIKVYGAQKLRECQKQTKSNLQNEPKLNSNKNLDKQVPSYSQKVFSQSSKKSSKHTIQQQSLYDDKKLFSLGQKANQKFIEQSIQKLKKGGVKVDLNVNTQGQFQIVDIFDCSSNYKTLTLQVKMGIFSTNIRILTSQQQHCHEYNFIQKGTYGQVYTAVKNNTKHVIKCQLKLLNSDNNHEKLVQIYKNFELKDLEAVLPSYRSYQIKQIQENFLLMLKQLFFYKIFSILEVGPSLKNIYGYDLVIFKNCYQFSMEYCLPVLRWNAQVNNNQKINQAQARQQMSLKIKKNLYLMHQLFVIHADIKEINMMYSPTYQKIVFLDFGTTFCLDNKAGFKTTIRQFIGTPFFSSPQMHKVNDHLKQKQIDLYYNDIFMLQIFLLNYFIQKSNYDLLKQTKQFQQTEQQMICQTIFYLQMNNLEMAIICLQQYLLKKNKQMLMLKILKTQDLIEIHFKILSQAIKINFTKATQQFFWYVLKNYSLEKLKQDQIKIINGYKTKIKIESQLFLKKQNKKYDFQNQNVIFFEKISKKKKGIINFYEVQSKTLIYKTSNEKIILDKVESQKAYNENKKLYFNIFLTSVLFKNSFFSSNIEEKSLASQIFLKIVSTQSQFQALNLEVEFSTFLKDISIDEKNQKNILFSLFYVLKLCQNLQSNQFSFEDQSKLLNKIWKRNIILQILQTYAYYGHFNQNYMKKIARDILKYTPQDKISQICSLINLKFIKTLIQYQFYQKKHQISQQFYVQYYQIQNQIVDQLLLDIQNSKIETQNIQFQTFVIKFYKDTLKYEFAPNLTNLQSKIFISHKKTLEKYYQEVCPFQIKQYLNYFLFRNQSQTYLSLNEIPDGKNSSTWLINEKLVKKNSKNFYFLNQFFCAEIYDWQKIKNLMKQFDNSIRDQQIQQRFLLDVRIKLAKAQYNSNGNLLKLVKKLVQNFQKYIDNKQLNFPYQLYCSLVKLNFQQNLTSKKLVFIRIQNQKISQFFQANQLLKKLYFDVTLHFFKQKQMKLQKNQLLINNQFFSRNIKEEILIKIFTSFVKKQLKLKKINSKQNFQLKFKEQRFQLVLPILLKCSQKYYQSCSNSYNFYKPLVKQLKLIESDDIFQHFYDLRKQFKKSDSNSTNYQFLQKLNQFLQKLSNFQQQFTQSKQQQQRSFSQNLKQITQFIDQRLYEILMLAFHSNNYIFLIKCQNIYNFMVHFLLFKYQKIKNLNQIHPQFKPQFESKEQPQFNMLTEQKNKLIDNINQNLKQGKDILNQDKLDGFILLYRFLLKFVNNSFGIIRQYGTVSFIYKKFHNVLNLLSSNDIFSLCYIILTQLKAYHQPIQCFEISPFFSIYLFCFAQKLTHLLYVKGYNLDQKNHIRKCIIQYMQIIQQVYFKQISNQYYVQQKQAILQNVFDVIYVRNYMKIQDIRALYVVGQKEITNKKQYLLQYIQKTETESQNRNKKEQQEKKQKLLSQSLYNKQIPSHVKDKMTKKLAQKLNALTYLRWQPQKFKTCKQNPKNRKLSFFKQQHINNSNFQRQQSLIQGSSSSSSGSSNSS